MATDVEGRDTGYLHESKDQGMAIGALAAWSRRARSPAEVVEAIDEAFASFASGRPRPVHVDIPLDVLEASGRVEPPPPAVPGPDLDDAESSASPRCCARPSARRSCSAAARAARQRPWWSWPSGSARRS